MTVTERIRAKTTSPERQIDAKFDKILFLKTHKTGSSSLENMMMRIALKYNKTVARPIQTNSLNFNIYAPFKSSWIRPIPQYKEWLE